MIEALNGVVVVDKPVGPSSFGIVSQARRLTGARKVGHGGTLDPAASGVLPICFGEATKIAQFLLDADKEYDATIRFGIATDTYDATGTVTARGAAGHLTRPQVEQAAGRFLGWIDQRPPAFSALKRGGQPLYALARAGQTVIVEPRRIRVDAFEVLELTAQDPEHPTARVRVACSKGTYIRSLAHDVGVALGTGAHLEALRRTRSGPFRIVQAVAPEALGEGGAAAALVPLAQALQALPSLTLSPALVQAVSQGKAIPWREVGTPEAGDGPVRLLDERGALVAVAARASAQAPDPGAEPLRTLRVFGRGLSDDNR
jgi:tRNA pseudouridine55 synthase